MKKDDVISKLFTKEEASHHNAKGDAWIIIDNKIYDVSKFSKFHPGGEQLLLEYAGKDASQIFYELHRTEVLSKYSKLVIGEVQLPPSHLSLFLFIHQIILDC